MDNKILKITVAVFVVLAIISFFPWLHKTISSYWEKNDQKKLSVDLSGFSKESVDKILIKKEEDEEKILSLNDGKWFIGNEEADQELIEDLFEDFNELKIKETVSQNEANHSKFEVTKEAGIKLTIFEKGKENVFFIGKAGSPSANEFYIRKEGIKNVYLAGGDLAEKLTWEIEKWKKEKEEEKKEE